MKILNPLGLDKATAAEKAELKSLFDLSQSNTLSPYDKVIARRDFGQLVKAKGWFLTSFCVTCIPDMRALTAEVSAYFDAAQKAEPVAKKAAVKTASKETIETITERQEKEQN